MLDVQAHLVAYGSMVSEVLRILHPMLDMVLAVKQ